MKTILLSFFLILAANLYGQQFYACNAFKNDRWYRSKKNAPNQFALCMGANGNHLKIDGVLVVNFGLKVLCDGYELSYQSNTGWYVLKVYPLVDGGIGILYAGRVYKVY